MRAEISTAQNATTAAAVECGQYLSACSLDNLGCLHLFEQKSLMLLWLKVVNQSKADRPNSSQPKIPTPLQTLAARNISRFPPGNLESELARNFVPVCLCLSVLGGLVSKIFRIFFKHGSEYKWFGNATTKISAKLFSLGQ